MLVSIKTPHLPSTISLCIFKICNTRNKRKDRKQRYTKLGARIEPALVMDRPNSRIIRHKSQPRPVLSGQLMVTTKGSPGFCPPWICTTSSFGITISRLNSRPAGAHAGTDIEQAHKIAGRSCGGGGDWEAAPAGELKSGASCLGHIRLWRVASTTY